MEELDHSFPLPASEKEAQREIGVVAAPEKRLRLEVGQRTDASGCGDVARFRQVVHEGVPGQVGCEDSRPRRQKKKRREGEPGRFERRRRVASRETHGPAPEIPNRRYPAPAQKQDERREDRESRRARQPRLAQQEHERPRRDGAGGEDRVEVALPGLRAGEHPEGRVAEEDSRPEDRGRGKCRGKVPGADHHCQCNGGEGESHGAGPPTDPEPGEEKDCQAGQRSRGEHGRRMLGGEFVGVGAHEGQRRQEKDTGCDGDEHATGFRSSTL